MNNSKTIANAQGAEVSTIKYEDDMAQKEVATFNRNIENITDEEWSRQIFKSNENLDCSDDEGNDWDWSDDEDYNPSYGEKCSLIDEFFEKKDLTYLRGDAPSEWFCYDFNENTFTMESDCYYIQIQPDGWINVSTQPDCGIGEFDIDFIYDLNRIKDELIEYLKNNYMLK